MLIARSIQRPACSAEYTPPAIPSGTTTMNASAPSFAELRERIDDERRDG